jgi:hypothetical protein
MVDLDKVSYQNLRLGAKLRHSDEVHDEIGDQEIFVIPLQD